MELSYTFLFESIVCLLMSNLLRLLKRSKVSILENTHSYKRDNVYSDEDQDKTRRSPMRCLY